MQPGPWKRCAQWVPLFDRLRRYRRSDLRHDARAALNVALLDFPQAMAYALIAGLPVQTGLYSSALGSITSPFFASSRFLLVGPTNATAVLLLSALATLGIPEEQRLVVLPLLVVMVAAVFFLAAALNAGVIVKYISRSVVTGYVTAAGCLIIVHQLRHVLGVDLPRDPTLPGTLWNTLSALPLTDPASLIAGGASLGLFHFLKHRWPSLPAVAITLVAMTSVCAGASAFLHVDFRTLGAFAAAEWPSSVPIFDAELFARLASPALAIAFLAFLESASIAKTLAARSGDSLDIRRQLVSLGAANAVCAFGSGMPVSGSPTRSTVNWASGARTPLASILSGILLVVGIFTLGPLIAYIPRAVLAALVISVGIALIDPVAIRTTLRTTRADALTFAVTAIGGLLLPLDTAVFAGVVTSLLLFLHKVAQPRLVEYAFNDRGELAEKSEAASRTIPAVSIVHVEGDLFFGSADLFLEQMRLLVQTENLKVVLLRLRNAHNLDATSAMAIADLVRFARGRGREVVVSGLQPEVETVFARAGLLELIGERNLFRYTPQNVTLATRDALRRAQEIIGREKADIILFATPKTPEN
jgi:SulP family sulfate permease